MKYVIITPLREVSGAYRLNEFPDVESVQEFIGRFGLGDCIVAKRMDVDISICEMPSTPDDF